MQSPFRSLYRVSKLLYLPNVDVSQRITILDIMTDAAQELADETKTSAEESHINYFRDSTMVYAK